MNDNLETVQLLPLTSDIVFKQVFGQEESKPFVVFLTYTKIPVTTEALFLKMKKQMKYTDKLSKFHSLSYAKQSANYLKQRS